MSRSRLVIYHRRIRLMLGYIPYCDGSERWRRATFTMAPLLDRTPSEDRQGSFTWEGQPLNSRVCHIITPFLIFYFYCSSKMHDWQWWTVTTRHGNLNSWFPTFIGQAFVRDGLCKSAHLSSLSSPWLQFYGTLSTKIVNLLFSIILSE